MSIWKVRKGIATVLKRLLPRFVLKFACKPNRQREKRRRHILPLFRLLNAFIRVL